ncbi:Flp pilus assembly protein CpaB [Vibrio agarilyticus]|nr:Flp pilus assembly protein CpaB [Vibrio agarilyticus]
MMKLLIPVALIAIGAGLYGLSQPYFNQSSQAPLVELAAETAVPQVTVYALAERISRGTVVSKTHFELRQIDQPKALQLGIDPSMPLNLTPGSVAIQDIAAGTLVSPSLFITPSDPGYIEAIVAKNKVPYAIEVSTSNMVGGIITHGAFVDVVALSSEQQNLANDETVTGYKTVSIAPVLMAVKVLQVSAELPNESSREVLNPAYTTLILELSQRQVAKLAIAKNISQLEVHKSLGRQEASDLQANSGDVLPDYRAIVEFRGDTIKIK